jgi:hypothetical protein
MAVADVLRGLLGGAGGALAGYGIQQQREQERLEREAERLERQEATKRQQAQADRLFALDLLAREARGEIAPTEYVEYAKPSDFLRGEAIGMQRPAAGADMSSILADQPIGMQQQAPSRRSEVASALSAEARDGRMEGGAMVAPGQTYSAIDRVLAEAEPTPGAEDIGARDTERPARGLDRVLDITPEDIAGRFERAPMQGSWTGGRGTFEGLDGQMYRAVTPEERAVMEEGALRRQLQLQSEIEFELVTAQRTKLADELGLTGVPRAEFITTGDFSVFAPRTVDREERDPFGAVISSLQERFIQATGLLPNNEQKAELVLMAAMATGVSLEEATRRVEEARGIDVPPPPPPPGEGFAGAEPDPIIAAQVERETRTETQEAKERARIARLNMLKNALKAGSLRGRPLTEGMRRDILREIDDLSERKAVFTRSGTFIGFEDTPRYSTIPPIE